MTLKYLLQKDLQYVPPLHTISDLPEAILHLTKEEESKWILLLLSNANFVLCISLIPPWWEQ